MHHAAYQFVQQATATLDLSAAAVLEIGSYNVNGSVRPLFASSAHYLGIDVRGGPDVDLVVDAADYDGGGQFDIVVSAEVLEHVPDPVAIIGCARRALSPGGLLILTAAGPERAPHGVDGGPVGSETYANLSADDLVALLDGWTDVSIHHNRHAGDVYATARMSEPPPAPARQTRRRAT